MITHEDLLSKLEKPVQGKEYFIREDLVINTNIDGIPYLDAYDLFKLDLAKNDKVTFKGHEDLYTLKSIDDSGMSNFKPDKYIDLNARKVDEVINHFNGWGMKKEAERVKLTHKIMGHHLNIEGKLSKNQVVKFSSYFYKIIDLVKDDEVIDIKVEHIRTKEAIAIYPYKEHSVIKKWFTDIRDVWIEQVKNYK